MKIGIFGGTFNPVHWGHLQLAEGARKQLGLDEVIWVPSQLPPHKPIEGNATPEDRTQMVKRAIQDQAGFSLSRTELDRPAFSYTIDTVKRLQEERPDPRITWYLILG